VGLDAWTEMCNLLPDGVPLDCLSYHARLFAAATEMISKRVAVLGGYLPPTRASVLANMVVRIKTGSNPAEGKPCRYCKTQGCMDNYIQVFDDPAKVHPVLIVWNHHKTCHDADLEAKLIQSMRSEKVVRLFTWWILYGRAIHYFGVPHHSQIPAWDSGCCWLKKNTEDGRPAQMVLSAFTTCFRQDAHMQQRFKVQRVRHTAAHPLHVVLCNRNVHVMLVLCTTAFAAQLATTTQAGQPNCGHCTAWHLALLTLC
jgi:hypothetical protein